jgi:two-component system LytT family response regulator
MRALLIDDEELAREELRRLLAEHPHVRIVGEADEVPAGRVRLAQADCDLVLLDIQLAGGSGFDLVPHVAPSARIVFVTAYDKFAVRAFEVNALDYLMKPVSSTRLAQMLARANSASSPAPVAGAPAESPEAERPLGTLAANDRVFLKNDRGARFVPLADLAVVISSGNYTEVFVADGSRFFVRRSLKTWETALPPDHFIRVHRQALVNLALIERIENFDSDTPTLQLRGVKQPVACSYRLTPELRRRVESRGR